MHLPRAVIAVGAALAVVVPLIIVTAIYTYAGDVPRGTTVLGIDLGGKSREQAVQALRDGLAGQLGAPVPVRLAEQSGTVLPGDVGLRVDFEATVRQASTGSRVDGLLRRGREVPPVIQVDQDRLVSALAGPAAKVTEAATAPAIRYAELLPTPIYARPGRAVDPGLAAQAMREHWLRVEAIAIPVRETAPAMSDAEVDHLLDTLARPAVAAPVTVTLPGARRLTVPPEAIARSLVLSGDAGGRIVPRVDEAALRAALASQLAGVEKTPRDAQVADGRVVASTGGELVDTAALARDLLPVLDKPAPRTVAGRIRTVPPKVSSSDLTRLGIRERVSTFTTNFTGGLSAPRSANIVQIAKEVDGTVVQPGATFSLNGHTGERGYAQGYQDAPIIYDGKLVPGVGGGVSQFTTTLFNATYYAGLQDVFHQPHGYYFSRYPAVIESTIFYPSLDFKFRNDSPYALMIDTSHTASSVTVSIWSTKRYDVSTEWGPRRDVVKPQVQRLPAGPTCIATEGSEGFTQDAWRIFRQGGKEVRREKFTWRYDAEPQFICEKQPGQK